MTAKKKTRDALDRTPGAADARQRLERDQVIGVDDEHRGVDLNEKMIARHALASFDHVPSSAVVVPDAEGNERTVNKGDVLSPYDPFAVMHPTMVGRPLYELEDEPIKTRRSP